MTNERAYLIEKFGITPRTKIPRSREGFYPVLTELGYKTGCEVGVYLAGNAVQILVNNPTIKLYLVDSYNRKLWFSNANYKYKPAEAYKKAWKKLKRFEQKYGLDYKFMVKSSKRASRQFSDNELDFVYIDANHDYEHVKNDLELWAPKVRIGGMISGHDYDKYSMNHFDGVVRAVDRFVKKYRIKPVYFTTDKPGSFFWIKEKDYA
jgi:hypothetical protein